MGLASHKYLIHSASYFGGVGATFICFYRMQLYVFIHYGGTDISRYEARRMLRSFHFREVPCVRESAVSYIWCLGPSCAQT